MIYSRLFNVIDNPKFANLKEENGDGGGCIGQLNGRYGYKYTDEEKSILSLNAKLRFQKGQIHPMLGKKHTNTSKFSRKMPEEIKQKIRKANLGKKLSEETKEKMRLAKLGKTTRLKGKPWSEKRKQAQEKKICSLVI